MGLRCWQLQLQRVRGWTHARRPNQTDRVYSLTYPPHAREQTGRETERNRGESEGGVHFVVLILSPPILFYSLYINETLTKKPRRLGTAGTEVSIYLIERKTSVHVM